MKVTVDTSELMAMSADLADAPRNAWAGIYKAVQATSVNVKDQWSENLGGATNPHSRMRHIGKSVDFDIGAVGGIVSAAAGVSSGIQADIGPNLAKLQGSMAGWWEEGVNGLPALHAGHDALRRNEADFINGLQIALAESLVASL